MTESQTRGGLKCELPWNSGDASAGERRKRKQIVCRHVFQLEGKLKWCSRCGYEPPESRAQPLPRYSVVDQLLEGEDMEETEVSRIGSVGGGAAAILDATTIIRHCEEAMRQTDIRIATYTTQIAEIQRKQERLKQERTNLQKVVDLLRTPPKAKAEKGHSRAPRSTSPDWTCPDCGWEGRKNSEWYHKTQKCEKRAQ